jgi:DNA primase
MATYIDFEKIKQQADFARVLTHYGFSVPQGRNQLKLPCPFHEDGEPSLSVNLARGIWHCFGCSAKGGLLDFVQQKEGVSVRQAALRLAEICGIADCEGKRPVKGARKPADERDPAPAGWTPG